MVGKNRREYGQNCIGNNAIRGRAKVFGSAQFDNNIIVVAEAIVVSSFEKARIIVEGARSKNLLTIISKLHVL